MRCVRISRNKNEKNQAKFLQKKKSEEPQKCTASLKKVVLHFV